MQKRFQGHHLHNIGQQLEYKLFLNTRRQKYVKNMRGLIPMNEKMCAKYLKRNKERREFNE